MNTEGLELERPPVILYGEGIGRFFAYARERYLILLARRAKATPPWTSDEILGSYRFCNVFREDDRTTQWFKRRIRNPLRTDSHVILATIIFRWFNRIETGEVLLKHGLFDDWDEGRAFKSLGNLQPLVTGAYMIKTPAKMKKLPGLIWCINNVWRARKKLQAEILCADTLEWAHSRVMEFPFLGTFMAYEIVTDLRHTHMLWDAADINEWASAGPGAARGLGRIVGNLDLFSYTSKKHQEKMLEYMSALLTLSRADDCFWPGHWPQWEMREVEHTLCEFDKYERVRLGEGTPKQRYTPPCM